MHPRTLRTLGAAAAVGAATLLLHGCGGGSSSEPAVTPDTTTQLQRDDQAASASLDGLMTFMRALLASSDDTAEARPVAGLVPPAADGVEPQPLL